MLNPNSITLLSFILAICSICVQGRAASDNKISPKLVAPSYLQFCNKTDPKLNECISLAIEYLRPHLVTGIKALSIPPCEPFSIPKLTIVQDSGAIVLNSEYAKIKVYGLSKFEVRGIRVDPEKGRFRMKLHMDKLTMNATYTINGKLLMVPLLGKGLCHSNFSDVDVTVSLRTNREKRNDKEYYNIKDLLIDFNIGHAEIQLDNLFDGDRELGSTMNRFINENWKVLVAEMKPSLEKSIGKLIKEIVQPIFTSFSVNELFPMFNSTTV